jgi:hypothetical protein
MRAFLVFVGCILTIDSGAPRTGGDDQVIIRKAGTQLMYSAPDSLQSGKVMSDCAVGMERVEQFFKLQWRGGIQVRLFPDRQSLTAYWRIAWKIPDLQVECWQVASGTASMLAILSPRVWKTEACDHDPDDSTATQLVIIHELVHAFHGQYNPSREFEGMDDVGWFVEGLATYVSGQLERLHSSAASMAIAEHRDPGELKSAWSGRYRYGVCGSMVRYIDVEYGREVLKAMLGSVTQEELLEHLGTSEPAFLSAWKRWVLSGSRNSR